ncbi:MAG: hypothetical protein ABID63_12135 [Pseudomonadota bacterium]
MTGLGTAAGLACFGWYPQYQVRLLQQVALEEPATRKNPVLLIMRVEAALHPGHAQEVENSHFARMLPFPLRHANSLEQALVMAENGLSVGA